MSRTIFGPEGLNALPVGSYIFDSEPDALFKRNDGWISLNDPGHVYKPEFIVFPATVLHEGDGA